MHYIWNITGRCNLSCPGCWDPFKDHRNVSAEVTEDVLARLGREGCNVVTLTGGEPLLHRNVGTLVRRLRDQGVAEVKICTNGILLARRARELISAGVNEVHVSLDSIDEDSHAALGNVDERGAADQVVAQLESFASMARSLDADVAVVLVTVVDPRRLDRLERLLQFAADGGYQVSLQLLCPFDAWLEGATAALGSRTAIFEAIEALQKRFPSTGMFANWLYLAAAKRYVLQGSHAPCGAGERFRVVSPDGAAQACFQAEGDPVGMDCFDERCLIWSRSQRRGERVSGLVAQAMRAVP